MHMMSASLLIVAFVCINQALGTTITADCDVAPDSATPAAGRQDVTGTVTLTQEDGGATTIIISLSGFNTTDNYQEHGFHIHENGDMSGGCATTGGHYNPHSVNHGSRIGDTTTRHVGDLGNIVEDGNGGISLTFNDSIVSLEGDYSVMGKAVVVHASKDDLGQGGDAGSLATGNAGGRLACCIIKQTSGATVHLPAVLLTVLLALLAGALKM